MTERWLVAMSGGVDSSVAAALVARAGHETIGVTMQLAGAQSRCCSLADADDARRVADRYCILDKGRGLSTGAVDDLDDDLARSYLSV